MADHGPRRSPAKHRAILEAAIAVFTGQGYARASVDAIAAVAGVGKQTVYGHFGDKEQLFLAAVDQARTVAPDVPEQELTFTGDPREDLTALGEQILAVALSAKVSALHRLTIAEVGHHPELQRDWRQGGTREIGPAAAYLRECDRDGRLDVPDPELAGRQFSFLVVTAGRVETAYGTRPLSPERRHAIAAESADLVVRAHRP
jgi:TetR/AcrR family transcriptional repressor of mexJK operon